MATTDSLRDLIAQHAGRLTSTDTRLLDVMMDDPVRAALDTGKDVSDRAKVHPAAAVRLAKKLGFAGYPAFRAFLRDRLIESGEDFRDPATRIMARLDRSTESSTFATILASEIRALQQLASHISDKQIAAAAETVAAADRVFVFGRGHAKALSLLVCRRLRRSGYTAVDLTRHDDDPAEVLHDLRPTDLMWLFVLREPRSRALDFLKLAADAGATTLAVTDLGGGRLEPRPTLHLSAPRGTAGESQSLVVPMTIANSIVLELAAIDEGRSLGALNRYAALRKQLVR